MIVDRPLLERLDRTAARLALETADGYRRVQPDGSVRARPFGDGALVALGPGRWVNRAVGVSVPAEPAPLVEMEAFFDDAGVDPSIEVGAWVSAEALAVLASRGYIVEWFRDVFVADPAAGESTVAPSTDVMVRRVDIGDATRWTEVFTGAFGSGSAEGSANAALHASAMLSLESTAHFVASIDSQVVGCVSLSFVDGVGWLGGAATSASHRGHGVQGALLRHRLGVEAEAGCDLAAATATPSGISARNLRRTGFAVAAAQAVMTRMIRPDEEQPAVGRRHLQREMISSANRRIASSFSLGASRE